MKRQTKIQHLENMMRSLPPFEGEINQAELNEIINSLIAEKDGALTLAPSCYFIYDNIRRKYVFIEESMKNVTNFSAQDVMKLTSLEFLNQLVVEEHTIPITYLAQKIYSSFYNRKNIEDASITMEVNIHPNNRPEEIRRLLIMFRPTHWNKDDKPLLNFGKMFDITHLSKMGAPRLTVIKNNKIIYKEEAESEYLTKQNDFCLTPKELKVITLIAEGLDNKAIAKKMNSSIATIYTHRKNIKGKTGKSMVTLISELTEKGLISQT